MKKLFLVLLMAMALTSCVTTGNNYPGPHYETYQEAVSNWTSDQDVAQWLSYNFSYSFSRKSQAACNFYRSPSKLYKIKKGFCLDAAYFAQQTLNKINPEYKAELIFVNNNAQRKYNHWVVGYRKNGDIYVMDYGVSSSWQAIRGVHGPYKNLDEYQKFLAAANAPNFSVGYVYWSSMPFSMSED